MPQIEHMTNGELRENLDNYGLHLSVVTEGLNGNVRPIDSVRTADFGEGPVIVLELGDILG